MQKTSLRRWGAAVPSWPAAAMVAFATIPGPPAGADPAGLCDAAALRASEATGVPLQVLQAIALTESGRSRGGRMRPWPWTINIAGEGRWFDSRAEAESHVRAQHEAGRRVIDIGCFQVNYRWHGAAFASAEAMFDPAENALYAARFLAGLEAELGSWEAAAGAYHSRTPALAERYRARFRTHLAALDDAPLPTADLPRQTTAYPLLQAGAPAGLGSLVPLGAARGSLIVAEAGALR